jgi:hypothetical protein
MCQKNQIREFQVKLNFNIYIQHLTLSYSRLNGLSDKTKGVVGYFANGGYHIKNRQGNWATLQIQ